MISKFEPVLMLIGYAAMAVAFIVVVMCACNFGTMMTDRSHCIVKDNNVVWFEGPAYQVNCKSLGTSTQCTENGGGVFTMVISTRHITGNNIVVECK